MSDAAIFEALDVSKNEIRLLDILPSDHKADEICCSLRTVSLNDAIKFDALSWCWGDAPTAGCITISGQAFECSPNLEAALRNFRDSSATRTFWVDATCINQRDLQEKSTQIALMTRIYEGAEVVRVWLGESAVGSDDAVQIMKELLKGCALSDCQLHGGPLNEEMIQSLCLLLERPWWGRVWVVQEVALARQAIMYCGSASFESVGLAEAVDDMVNKLILAEIPFQHIKSDTIEQLTRRLLKAFERMLPVLQMLQMAKDIKTGDLPLHHTVDSIIALSSLKATDPRDKVYGCLGLLPGLSNLTVPDYSAFVDVVYTITTWALIAYSRCLYPLCFVRPRRTVDIGGEKITFPSWSLDFSQSASKSPNLFMMFSCCGDWGPFATQIRFPFLETPAVFFDEIESCFAMSSSRDIVAGFIGTARHIHGRWRAFFGLHLDHSDHSTYVGGGSIENAYWRLVAGDAYQNLQKPSNRQRLKAAQIEPFVKWVRNPKSHGLTPDSPEWETNRNVMEYQYSVHRSTSKKNNTYLFKTRKGYMGMSAGVPDIRVGDRLHFLDRGEVPWALRPVHDEVEGTVFEVASECYVHGVMDGEAFRPPPSPESKTWKRHELRRKIFGGRSLDTSLPLPPWTKILLT